MRQLLPVPGDVDPYDVYRPDAPELVRINMVASVDGAVVDEHGRSGSLGGAADREVFRVLRALSDVIVVGAGTARREGYGPHRMPARLAQRRAAEGRALPSPIAVVSASLDLDVDTPLFAEAVVPTIVLTTATADPSRRTALARAATVLEVGEEAIDPARARRALVERGLPHILVEGGPQPNAALIGAGVVDELCLTLSPALVGGDGPRLAGALTDRQTLSLRGALVEGDELFLRYAVGPKRWG